MTMVKSSCKADRFQSIENRDINITYVRFTKEVIYDPVYEGEGEESHPTGEVVDSGFVRYTEAIIHGEPSVEKILPLRIEDLKKRDQSSDINEFIFGDQKMWLDDATRTKLSKRFDTDEQDGLSVTKLIYNGVSYTLPIEQARAMLHAIESYARDCFDKTNEHAQNLTQMTTVEELLAYDITIGYPQKLVFEI